jgi:hypothetical protein
MTQLLRNKLWGLMIHIVMKPDESKETMVERTKREILPTNVVVRLGMMMRVNQKNAVLSKKTLAR